MTTSLIILLWACGAVINLADEAIRFDRLHLCHVYLAISFAPIAYLLPVRILIEYLNDNGHLTIWERKE